MFNVCYNLANTAKEARTPYGISNEEVQELENLNLISSKVLVRGPEWVRSRCPNSTKRHTDELVELARTNLSEHGSLAGTRYVRPSIVRILRSLDRHNFLESPWLRFRRCSLVIHSCNCERPEVKVDPTSSLSVILMIAQLLVRRITAAKVGARQCRRMWRSSPPEVRLSP